MNITILVMASGEGRRFGEIKQLAMIQGKPMLQRVYDNAARTGYPIKVALGAHYQSILSHPLISIPASAVVSVQDWRSGLGSSISESVTALVREIPELQGLLLLLGDQPLVGLGELELLLAAIHRESDAVIASRYPDGAGVPAYFPARTFSELQDLKGDQGARKVLSNLSHTVVDLGDVLMDIDTPEQWLRLNELIREKKDV